MTNKQLHLSENEIYSTVFNCVSFDPCYCNMKDSQIVVHKNEAKNKGDKLVCSNKQHNEIY